MTLTRLANNEFLRSCYFGLERFCGAIPDQTYMYWKYRFRVRRRPDFDHPATYTEKIQWMKLHFRPELYTDLTDKYKVRDYVTERLGEELLVPILGRWDRPEDIDFDSLPDKFVLKCTHDSGSILICRDKQTFDRKAAVRHLRKTLKRDYSLKNREWTYHDVERKILAEPLLQGPSGEQPIEYKFFCFHGKAELIMKEEGEVRTKKRTSDYYDRDFQLLDMEAEHPRSDHPQLQDIAALEQMRSYAETLSQSMPHVRVDFYHVNGKIYFGEMTFFSFGGFMRMLPGDWDQKYGDLLHLPKPEKKKRIMLVISSLAGGGAERVTVNLSSALNEYYHVCVVTLFGNPDDYTVDDSVELFRYMDYRNNVPRLKSKVISRFGYLSKEKWFKELKQQWKPDVTISMLTVPNLLNALTDEGDFRIVSERADPQALGGRYYRSAKFSSARADHTVFQSHRVQKMFSEKVQKKSSIILNPVTVPCMASEETEKRIVTAGRLDGQKNHKLLISAFGRFHQDHPDHVLEIYGKGPLQEELEQQIEALGLVGNVKILNFAPDLHERIRNAEMFVLSSDFEGLSNALLESMMMGIPCISSDCAGSDEIIEHMKNGILFPVGNEDDLLEVMTRLADDPALRKTIAEQAKATSKRFSRDVVIKQWIELIESNTKE